MESASDSLASDKLDYFVEFFEQCAVNFVDLANISNLNRIMRHVFKLIDTSNVKENNLFRKKKFV